MRLTHSFQLDLVLQSLEQVNGRRTIQNVISMKQRKESKVGLTGNPDLKMTENKVITNTLWPVMDCLASSW